MKKCQNEKVRVLFWAFMTSMSDLALISSIEQREKLILYIGAWIDAFMRPKKHWLRMKLLLHDINHYISHSKLPTFSHVDTNSYGLSWFSYSIPQVHQILSFLVSHKLWKSGCIVYIELFITIKVENLAIMRNYELTTKFRSCY